MDLIYNIYNIFNALMLINFLMMMHDDDDDNILFISN